MPKLQIFADYEPIHPNLCNVLHHIKELDTKHCVLITEEEGNAEALITRNREGYLFVEAPNNKREDLTFLTHSSKAAYDAAKDILAAYYSDAA